MKWILIAIAVTAFAVALRDYSRTPTPTREYEEFDTPRLEPTPSQEEINERVTKALRLNPPL